MKNTKETDKFFKSLTDLSMPQDICRARTIYCLNWYSQKATLYKNIYHILSIINIAAPLLSSVIISISPQKDLLVAILSAIASFCASLLSLFGAKDKWTNYRTTAEFIKTQYTLYLSKSTPYNIKNSDASSLYLNTIETQMQNIHSHWVNFQNNTEHTDCQSDT